MKLNVLRTIDQLTSSLKSIINSKDSFSTSDPEKVQKYLIEFQTHLKEADHSKIISILSLINKASPGLLIPIASYRLQQITLQVYTLTTLEAYLSIYTSTDSHTKKAYKIILEIYNKAQVAIQDPLTSEYFSQVYMVKSTQGSIQYYTDGCLVLLKIFTNLIRTQNSSIDWKMVEKNYLVFIAGIKNSPDFVEGKFSSNSIVACEKFFNVLELLKEMLTRYSEASGAVLETREKLKECFILSLKFILSNSKWYDDIEINSGIQLEKLFESMAEVLQRSTNSHYLYQQFYDVPVIIIHLILSDNEFLCKTDLYDKLKTCVLMFLYNFYSEKFKKYPESVDIGIEDLLLSSFLFEQNSFSQQETWENLWNEVCEALTHLDGIMRTISSNILANLQNYSYLASINQLLINLLSVNKKKIDESAYFSLIFDIIQALNKDKVDGSIRQMLFQILNFVFEFAVLLPEHQMKVVNYFLLEIIPNEDDNSYFFAGILSNILKVAEQDTVKHIIRVIKISKKVEFVDLLMVAVSKLLMTHEGLKKMLEYLIRAGFTELCALKMLEKGECEKMLNNWEETFELLKFIRARSELTFNFDFEQAITVFRYDYMDTIRNEIIEKTSENLLKVVFCQKNKKIFNPKGTQLIIEYISSAPSTSKKLPILLKSFQETQEFPLFVKNNFLSVVLYHTSKHQSLRIWQNLTEHLVKSIQIDINFKDYTELIKLINSIKNETRLSLLEILKHSLSMKNKNQSFSNCLIIPQPSPKQIKLNSGNTNIEQTFKVFSFHLWVFAASNCEIVTLNFSSEFFSVQIHNSKFQVKSSSILIESEKIELFNWFLIVFSCNFSKPEKKISLFVSKNSNLIDKKDFLFKNNLGYEPKSIHFGGGSQDNKLMNRIKSFYLCSKVLGLKEVTELAKISWRYTIMNFPMSEEIDIKVVSEIRECLIVTWESIIAKSYKKNDILGGSQVFDVVRAYCPCRLLYELCENTENLKDLFEIFSICERIICFSNYFFISNKDFFRYLGHYFTKKPLDIKTNEVFLDIIKSTPDKYNKILFESYMINTKSLFLLKQSKRLDEVIHKFIKIYPFCKINLMKFCKMLSGMTSASCVNYLKKYFDKNIEKSEVEIASVLIHLIKIENFFMIKCFLEVLFQDSVKMNVNSKLFVVTLHIIDTKHDASLQVLVIKLLCHKIYYDKKEEKPDKIVNLISQILPDSISKELFEFLLDEGFSSDKHIQEIQVALINIALTRVKNIQIVSQIDYLLEKLEINEAKILEFVYNNENFPSWLIFAKKYSNFKTELEKITKCIFKSVINKPDLDLSKLQELLSELPDLELYLYLFTHFHNFQLDKCFHFFCILWWLPVAFVKSNIEGLVRILAVFRNCEPFMRLAEESFQVEFIKLKLDGGNRDKSLMLVGEILKFLMYLLRFDKKNSLIIEEIQKFLMNSHIKCFSKYYNSNIKSKEDCETFTSVYFFYMILKKYYKNPGIWSGFLQSYIENSQIFAKILKIMNESLSTSLFFKICISKSTAILPSGGISLDPDFNCAAEFDSYCFGADYETVQKNSTICEHVYSTKEFPVLDIIDKNNPAWKVVYNCIEVAVNNYTSLDEKWKTGIFVPDTGHCEVFELGKIQLMLKSLLDDPWFEMFDDDMEKERYKIEYDLLKFGKIYKRTKKVIDSAKPSKTKVRQCYDKWYRWGFLKPYSDKSLENVSNPILLKSKSEILPIELSTPTLKPNISEPVSLPSDIFQNSSSCFTCVADYIKIKGTCFGKIFINKTFFEFSSNLDTKPSSPFYYFSSLRYSMVQKKKRHIWYLSEISEIILKKFIHQHCSFELILKSGKSYLFNVFNEDIRKNITQRFSENKKIVVFGKNPQSEIGKFTKDWKKNKLNNFEYLMILNKLAGRCMHDISQYPIFPWILTDYSQETQFLEDCPLRNLYYPVGAQNEKTRESGIKKYLEWTDDSLIKFIFGSHYSNAGVVLHYLVRLEPFSSQAKDLQNGDFDVGDRLFYSLDMAWKSTQSGGGDCKELVPELFYQPWCLYSYSEQSYGKTQVGQEIIHLQVPNCAVSNWDFIKKHRILLESPCITSNLHAWIDLIFGCKQQGEKALQYCNIFCGDTYEQSFNAEKNNLKPSSLQSMIEKVYHFGQTPSLLFVNLHVKKEDNGYLSENGLSKYLAGALEMGIQEKAERIKGVVVAAFVLNKTAVMVKRKEKMFFIFKISIKGLEDSNLSSEYCLKNFPAFEFEGVPGCRRKLKYSIQSFALFREKFLVSAMHLSNSLMVHNMKGELVQTLFFHSKLTISVSKSENFLFSGSLDSTLACWEYTESNLIVYKRSFFGHNSAVFTIKVLESYCVVVSASENSLILIHDFRNSECLVKIDQQCEHLDVSELGFLSCANENIISFFHVTGENIYQESVQELIQGVKFTPLGEYCIVQHEDKVIIKDPTDQRTNGVLDIAKILVFDFHAQDKYIAIWKLISDVDTTFCTVKYDNRYTKKLIRS